MSHHENTRLFFKTLRLKHFWVGRQSSRRQQVIFGGTFITFCRGKYILTTCQHKSSTPFRPEQAHERLSVALPTHSFRIRKSPRTNALYITNVGPSLHNLFPLSITTRPHNKQVNIAPYFRQQQKFQPGLKLTLYK